MRTTVFALLLACLPAVAGAVSLSYRFGEARLIATDPDGRARAQGFVLDGSTLLTPTLFVDGSFRTTGSSGGTVDDTDQLHAALGLRYPFTPAVDLIGRGGLVHVDVDNPAGSDEDLGPLLSGGGRIRVTTYFEGGVRLEYHEVFGDGDIALLADALWHLTPQLALVGGVEASDDDRAISAGARWNF